MSRLHFRRICGFPAIPSESGKSEKTLLISKIVFDYALRSADDLIEP
jgi:hypothetical protein